MWVEEPGSARNQIGLSLCEIREAIRCENVYGVANHTRYLLALASPHLGSDSAARFRAIMPNPDKADEQEVFEACMSIVETLLRQLAHQGLYTWLTPTTGDATDLAL